MGHDRSMGLVGHVDRGEPHAFVERHSALGPEFLWLAEEAEPDALDRIGRIEKPLACNLALHRDHEVGWSARHEDVAQCLQASHFALVKQNMSWHLPSQPTILAKRH